MNHHAGPGPTHAREILPPTRNRTLVLYEDITLAGGSFDFALRLGSEAGLDIGCPETHWCFNMVRSPLMAGEVRRDALASSYVVLALHGNRELAPADKRWLEEWLTNPHSVSIALMILFEASPSNPAAVARIKSWIQSAVVDTPVAAFFYSIPAATKSSSAAGSDLGPAFSRVCARNQRRIRRRVRKPTSSAAMSATKRLKQQRDATVRIHLS
jgi:hypothetical protein